MISWKFATPSQCSFKITLRKHTTEVIFTCREREREREREELTVRNNTRGEGQRTNLNFLPTRITLTVKTNNWSIGGLACSLPTFYHCTHSSCTHTPPLSPTYKIIITDPNHANQNQITTKKKSETFKGT
jgi:hypothetical protein